MITLYWLESLDGQVIAGSWTTRKTARKHQRATPFQTVIRELKE